MQFPYSPKHLQHNSGSRITAIHALFHEQYPPIDGRSQDMWGATCQIEWRDTGKVSEANVFMVNIGYDGTPEGHAEFCTLSALMVKYLTENGEWRDSKPEGWYAHRASKR
jgi:hypothetical protein